MKRYNAITAALAIATTVGIGLLGATESQAATHSDTVYATDAYYGEWTTCAPGTLGYGLPVHIADDGSVYGDQDHNGIIDGEDCNWL